MVFYLAPTLNANRRISIVKKPYAFALQFGSSFLGKAGGLPSRLPPASSGSYQAAATSVPRKLGKAFFALESVMRNNSVKT